MSTSPRYDPLGLSELDSRLAPEAIDFVYEPALAPEALFPETDGLPPTRTGRIESRRAFVEMKQLFMRAVENLAHRKGA